MISRHEEQDYRASLQGYQGYRALVYTLRIMDVSELKVRLPAFPFVERPSGNLVPSRSRTISYPVSGTGSAEPGSGEVRDTVYPFLAPSAGMLELMNFRKNPRLLLWFLPGPAALMIALLIRRGGGRKTLTMLFFIVPCFWIGSSGIGGGGTADEYRTCREFYEAADYRAAYQALVSQDLRYAGRAFHEYNKAVVLRELGELPLAIVALNQAVAADPMNRQYREVLTRLEEEAGIRNAYPSMLRLDPRLMFFALVLLVNILCLLAVFYIFRPGGVFIIMILSAAFILADLGFFAVSLCSANIPRGIVMTCTEGDSGSETPAAEVYLKRIPRSEGEDWLPVKCGTQVRIRDRAGDYVLVENGEKISGWLSADCLAKAAAP